MKFNLSKIRNTVLTAGAALLCAFSSADAGSMKLGMTTWVGYGPLFLARDMGYFKEEGLDVSLEIIEEAALYMAAVAAGQLNGSASTVDEIMKYRSKDFCFKSVYALDDSNGGDGVLVPKNVKSLKDIKGMEVGMNEGSVSQFWFNMLLKDAGMTEKDVKVTNMTADDAAAAFMADRIAVAVTWEPHLTLAKRADKGKVLVDSSQTPGAIVDVVALDCTYIKENPKDVKALVKGLYKANELIKSDPEKAYAVMAKGIGGWLSDPKEFAASAAGVNFYDKERNNTFFANGDDGEAGKLISLASDIWGKFGKLKMDISYKDMVDTQFLDK
ncbi:MAG: ABC transporter substrate-binding protein [Methylocystaceae bacterium]|nr:ABC transporter substrate-binding protein [Methylocystaceae bacterium]